MTECVTERREGVRKQLSVVFPRADRARRREVRARVESLMLHQTQIARTMGVFLIVRALCFLGKSAFFNFHFSIFIKNPYFAAVNNGKS